LLAVLVSAIHLPPATEGSRCLRNLALSLGPNVLIVTMTGYVVAGDPGTLAATRPMCLASASLAYDVIRILSR
jgi:hypothetical protein